jgi:predicted ATPase
MSNKKLRTNNNYLSRISIQNFKAFGKMVDVPIRPITLIFGENSSGKSSILHSLLFLNQMQHQPQDKLADITYTKVGGNSVDLGGLPQLRYGHTNSGNLSFQIEKLVIFNAYTKNIRRDVRKQKFYFAIRYSFDNSNNLDTLEYFINNVCIGNINIPNETSEDAPKIRIYLDNLISILGLELDNQYKELNSNEILSNLANSKFSSSIIEYTLKQSRREILETYFIPYGYEQEAASYRLIYKIDFFTLQQLDGKFQTIPNPTHDIEGNRTVLKEPIRFVLLLNGFLRIVQRNFVQTIGIIDELKYLGPIRTIPTRNFDTADSISSDPSTGSTAWDVLKSNHTVLEQVNEWLDKFGTKKRILTEQLVDTAQIYKLVDEKTSDAQFKAAIQALSKRPLLRFYDSTKHIYLSHRDLGIGISQVLPVVVNCVANTNTTVLIEQPELHLHPRLQGDLADLFIETAITGSQENTYLLETHSEALILRLLRRVREGVIKPDDIAILYVSSGEDGSNVTHIRVDKDGDFMDRWPNGFFEETYRDRMGF